jgi:hypothetical protein
MKAALFSSLLWGLLKTERLVMTCALKSSAVASRPDNAMISNPDASSTQSCAPSPREHTGRATRWKAGPGVSSRQPGTGRFNGCGLAAPADLLGVEPMTRGQDW